MEMIIEFIKLFLHDMPTALENLSHAMGPWFYIVLFTIVFCETGLVVTPFLPGDSLLFAAGAVCALPGAGLDVYLLGVLLLFAALLGDNVNYTVAQWATKKFVSAGRVPFNSCDAIDKNSSLTRTAF